MLSDCGEYEAAIQSYGRAARANPELADPRILARVDYQRAEEAYAGWPERLYVIDPSGTVDAALGGAPFNVAWHLRGFGHDPLMVSRVGRDEKGDETRRDPLLGPHHGTIPDQEEHGTHHRRVPPLDTGRQCRAPEAGPSH